MHGASGTGTSCIHTRIQAEGVATPSMERDLPGPLLICIEGNIGCGKTTIIKALQERLQHAMGVRVLEEPVDEWERHGFLKAMYEDSLSSAVFQIMVLSSLTGDMLAAMAGEPAIIITERSAWSNFHVFAKASLSGMELEAAEFAFNRVVDTLPKKMRRCILHLKLDPDTAKKRTDERARNGEEGISHEYLSRLDRLHEEWLSTEDDVTVVDCSDEKDIVLRKVMDVISTWAGQAAIQYVASMNTKPPPSYVEKLISLCRSAQVTVDTLK